MNRHSLLKGNDPTKAAEGMVRSQRIYCANRGQRGGCGRSFSVFFADILPRHTLSTSFLWQLLSALLSGSSIRTVFYETKPFVALESIYMSSSACADDWMRVGFDCVGDRRLGNDFSN